MNLHAIAARAIGAVHPNQELVLVRCLGSVNESGLLLGQFGSCEAVTAQVQSLSGDELKLEHELYEVDIVRKFFFTVTGRPVFAGIKLLEAGSDFLYQRSTGQFWRVFNIAEDYYLSGWVQAFAALQNNPPQGAVIALVDSGLLSDAEADALRTKFHIGDHDEEETTEPDSEGGGDGTGDGNDGGGDGTGNAGIGADNAPTTIDPEYDSDHTGDAGNASTAAATRCADFWSY